MCPNFDKRYNQLRGITVSCLIISQLYLDTVYNYRHVTCLVSLKLWLPSSGKHVCLLICNHPSELTESIKHIKLHYTFSKRWYIHSLFSLRALGWSIVLSSVKWKSISRSKRFRSTSWFHLLLNNKKNLVAMSLKPYIRFLKIKQSC